MHFSTRTSRRLAVVAGLAAAGLALAAVPAHASGGPSDINGTAVVPSSLTLTLSASSFNATTPGGVTTTTTGGGITATIATNDANGYQLTEDLQTAMAGGSAFDGSGTHFIPGSDIFGYSYSGVGQLGAAISGGFPSPGNYLTLYTAPAASSGNGDTFPLQWAFAPPSNQAPDSYSGTFAVLAAAN